MAVNAASSFIFALVEYNHPISWLAMFSGTAVFAWGYIVIDRYLIAKQWLRLRRDVILAAALKGSLVILTLVSMFAFTNMPLIDVNYMYVIDMFLGILAMGFVTDILHITHVFFTPFLVTLVQGVLLTGVVGLLLLVIRLIALFIRAMRTHFTSR